MNTVYALVLVSCLSKLQESPLVGMSNPPSIVTTVLTKKVECKGEILSVHSKINDCLKNVIDYQVCVEVGGQIDSVTRPAKGEF